VLIMENENFWNRLGAVIVAPTLFVGMFIGAIVFSYINSFGYKPLNYYDVFLVFYLWYILFQLVSGSIMFLYGLEHINYEKKENK